MTTTGRRNRPKKAVLFASEIAPDSVSLANGNGKGKVRLLTRQALDGRTRARKQYDTAYFSIIQDLGGEDQLGTVMLGLAEAYASELVALRHLNAKLLLGDSVDCIERGQVISNICRLASRIGTVRVARDITPLRDRWAREIEADNNGAASE